MTRSRRAFRSVLVAILTAAGCVSALPAQSILPPPPIPVGNAPTPDKVMLGKVLFWDEQLSTSNGIACGSCHVLGRDGTDPRAPHSVHPGADGLYATADDVHGSPGVPQHDAAGRMIANATFGVQWQVSRRRAPPVINAAYLPRLFADGRIDDVFRDPLTGAVVLGADAALENQILVPLVSETEMAHGGRTWSDVANHVASLTPLAIAESVPPVMQQFIAGQSYASLFTRTFGTPGVTPTRIVLAIAAYERTLISDRSPFDLYLAGQGALTPLQSRGLAVFQQLCATCHTDLAPNVLVTGPVIQDFRNTGVRPAGEDIGRAAVTGVGTDRGSFRVPGLRNVALRSNWFHDGSRRTLDEVLDFYDRGGDHHAGQDPLVLAIRGRISSTDRAALLALLHSLTDPRVAGELPPFDRPRLWLEGVRVPTAFGTGTAANAPQPPRISALGTVYHGNDWFGIGVDRIAPNLFTALMVDLTGANVPTSHFGLNVYLGVTTALLALPLGATKLSPDGSGYHSHVFHVPPSQAAPGTYWVQWIALDPSAPFGVIASDAMRLIIP